MKTITASVCQRGILRQEGLYPRADEKSAACCCRNVHSTPQGDAVPCHEPAQMGVVEGRLIGIHRTPERDIFFSQADDGMICTEGYTTPEGDYVAQYTELNNPGMRVEAMSVSGSLVVLSMQDGTLMYLKIEGEGYRWLGMQPDTPQVTAVAEVSALSAEATMEGYDFGEVIKDLRPGIPERVSAALGARLLATYTEALSRLHSSGLWHNPVAVRFGYRLYDGSLLSLSDPVPVGLERGISYCPVVNLPLTVAMDDDNNPCGYSGTDSATLQLHGYSIRTSCPQIPEEWRGVISCVEMYVTAEPEGVDMDTAPRASLRQVVGLGEVISLRAARLESSRSYSVYSNGVWYRHSVSVGGDLQHTRCSEDVMKRLDMQELAELSSGSAVKARLLLCHDDMVHMADISRCAPIPLPGGYPSDADGNATLEALTAGTARSVGRFSLPGSCIMQTTDTTIALHAPLLLWHSGAGAGRFLLRIMHEGRVYETYLPGTAVYGEEAWMYLTDGGEGLPLSATELPSLELPMTAEQRSAGTVITMRRGNPLIAVSHTDSVGGEVQGIAAQCVGGGAYTRQYIYLFTHLGVTALTHNYEGVHTNCRTISPEHISRPASMSVSTSHGVYALADSGKLLLLTDAQCRTIYSEMGKGWKALGWDGAQDELWICHRSESMVTDCRDASVHVRDCRVDSLLQCGTVLYAMQEYRLLRIGEEGNPCTRWQWRGMPEPYLPGVKRLLQIPVQGLGTGVQVDVEHVAEDVMPWEDGDEIADAHRCRLLARVMLRGAVHRPLPLMLYPLSQRRDASPSLLRVSITSNQ